MMEAAKYPRFATLLFLAGLGAVGCGSSSAPTAPSPPPAPPIVAIPPVPSIPPWLNPAVPLPVRIQAVPISETFTRAGISIELHDGHDNADNRLADDERRILKGFLELVPIDHLRSVRYVATLPVHPDAPVAGLASWDDGFVVFFYSDPNFGRAGMGTQRTRAWDAGGAQAFSRTTTHEIGHHVLRKFLQPEEWAEREDLFRNSSDSSDFAPALGTNAEPYGGANVDEDSATIYAEWATRPQVALIAALETYQRNGRSILLQKYLQAMSLFSNAQERQVMFVQFNGTNGFFRNPTGYVRSGSELSFRITCDQGLPANCLPMELRLGLSGNSVNRIEYTDARGSFSNPRRVILNANPSIPLPRTVTNRM